MGCEHGPCKKGNSCKPYGYTRDDLQDLDIGDFKQQNSGCGPYNAFSSSGGYKNACKNKGFSFPSNDEFQTLQGTEPTKAKRCDTCGGDTGNYGCSTKGYSESGTGCICCTKGGCCTPITGVGGRRCAVKRVRFKGNRALCCLNINNDVNRPKQIGRSTGIPSNPGPDFLNRMDDNTFTCNKDSRKIGKCVSEYMGSIKNVCSSQNQMAKYYLWDVYPSEDSKPYKGVCANFLTAIPENNISQAGDMARSALNSYSNDGKSIDSDVGADPYYVNDLLNYCAKYGGCGDVLKSMCSAKNVTRENVRKAFTYYANNSDLDTKNNLGKRGGNANNKVRKMLANKNLYRACGCHMPAKEYIEWGEKGMPQVTHQCDPVCLNLPDVVPQFDKNNRRIKCTRNICVMDDININIINSKSGGINFNVACGNCGKRKGNNNNGDGNNNGDSGSKGCQCYFSDIDINTINSKYGNLNISQNCSTCIKRTTDNQGNNVFKNLDCKTGNPLGTGLPEPPSTEKPQKETGITRIWKTFKDWVKSDTASFIVILGVIIAIFAVFLWAIYDKQQESKSFKLTQEKLNKLFGESSEDYMNYQ